MHDDLYGLQFNRQARELFNCFAKGRNIPTARLQKTIRTRQQKGQFSVEGRKSEWETTEIRLQEGWLP